MPENTPQPLDSDRHSRAQAWQLLIAWTQGESLRKHALAVEACVAACGDGNADEPLGQVYVAVVVDADLRNDEAWLA